MVNMVLGQVAKAAGSQAGKMWVGFKMPSARQEIEGLMLLRRRA